MTTVHFGYILSFCHVVEALFLRLRMMSLMYMYTIVAMGNTQMTDYGYIIVSAACIVFASRDLTSGVEGCTTSIVCLCRFVWHCCSMPAPIKWPYEPYRGEIQALFIVFFIDMVTSLLMCCRLKTTKE